MLEALLSAAFDSDRLVIQETPTTFQLTVKWFGLAFPLSSVPKEDLKARQRPKLGLVS